MGTADLHVHTTASDGSETPAIVVQKAVKKGLSAIAITDHDTIAGIKTASNEAKKYNNFIVVPGIEISTEFENSEVHILGYFIDSENLQLNKTLNKLKNERELRGQKIIHKLNRNGINITINKVRQIVGSGIIGRTHIAKALVVSGYSKDIQSAFDKYLLKGRLAYVPRQKITPLDALNLIKKANGISVLAHPIFLKDKAQIIKVLKYGFQGVEIEYPNHPDSFKIWLHQVAKDMKLITTGGSDYHGEYKNVDIGESTVDFNVIKELQNIIRKGKFK
jgi:predicted metal-dependent phosphoesterase TrpH